jgi:hypothetical protein
VHEKVSAVGCRRDVFNEQIVQAVVGMPIAPMRQRQNRTRGATWVDWPIRGRRKLRGEGLGLFDGKIAAERQRKQRFGEVRPIIHADAWGKKLVAAGSRIYFNDDPAMSFPDFLQNYLRALPEPTGGRPRRPGLSSRGTLPRSGRLTRKN